MVQLNFNKSDAEIYGEYRVDLQNIMLDKDISRTHLSKLTGIKYDIINKYYKGYCKQIDLGTIAKICFILDCKIEDIVVYEFKNRESDKI